MNLSSSVTVIHVEGLDKMDRTPAAIMEELLEQHQVLKTTQSKENIRAALCMGVISGAGGEADALVHICQTCSWILRL